jgi:putative flavoprotein involved in K+ transport
MTGRDGGRDIDLRDFARRGMRLHGHLIGIDGEELRFADDLAANLDHADAVADGIKDAIDRYIERAGIIAPIEDRYVPLWQPGEDDIVDLRTIETVIWSTGFHRDHRWIEVPIFDGRGYPTHERGVTSCPGLYFLGLPWQYTWGSGRFAGIARDATHLADRIGTYRNNRFVDQVSWLAGTPTETYPTWAAA